MIKINDDINIHFPLELSPREQQIDALNFFKKSVNNGKKYMIDQTLDREETESIRI